MRRLNSSSTRHTRRVFLPQALVLAVLLVNQLVILYAGSQTGHGYPLISFLDMRSYRTKCSVSTIKVTKQYSRYLITVPHRSKNLGCTSTKCLQSAQLAHRTLRAQVLYLLQAPSIVSPLIITLRNKVNNFLE
jgi:hypothetical protein